MLELSGLVLGVDLGVSSLGLALVDPVAKKVVHTAVRVFPAGVEGDFEAGRDESKNKKRRDARLARRQTERRARRSHKIFKMLQAQGLLPEGERSECLKALDSRLSRIYPPHPGVPYSLRAKALDAALEEYELGRALYHLAQRRGFLSNRLAPVKDDEELGKVSGGIEELKQEMAERGARTLGEYFAGVNPHEKRIRSRYTHRKMYEAEFDAIWSAQAAHHKDKLTAEFRAGLRQALFFQRPLKDQSHLVGACSLLADERRAPAHHLDAQRWRLLDKVNNLRLADPDERLGEANRKLLLKALTDQEKLTYAQARKLLELPKTRKFSIEGGGETAILGNVTHARFAKALNLKWDQMQRAAQDELVALWASQPDDESFREALGRDGGYSAEEIEELCKIRLPDTYMNLSLAAMRRLLPHMEAGMTYGEARLKEFPESLKPVEPKPSLPPVTEALPELRNPAVARALTELRKAVNEVVRKYGKPKEIRIELARDLKRNKKDRQAMSKKNRDNEANRDKARAALLAYPVPNPSRWMIEKYLLWEECEHTCPYSGRSISLQALLDGAAFEVEHIIPHSRSLDDSFQNKTLCARDYNARKGNRTPWEAFGANAEEWDAMVRRIKKLGNKGKLKKFELRETDTAKLLEEFSSNQLNDTRYMSKLAGKYLGTLYGGVNDATQTQRIYACTGGVTGLLRRMWDLNRILSEAPEKSRDDHRHHAVDAATVAVVTQGMIQRLGNAVRQAEESGQRRIRSFEQPWPGFTEELTERIKNQTVVSHRPERKLSGALHEETLYGRPHVEGGKAYVHVRKPVHLLSGKEIDAIVDGCVRERVKLQLGILGGEIKRLEHEPARLESGVPIRRVRVRMVAKTTPVGQGVRQRHVITGDNHHMAVFAAHARGRTSYVGEVVSRLEAVRRHAAKEPVVRKEREDSEFLFTLSEGDMVRWKDELWRVRGVAVESNGRLDLSPARDARLKEEMKKSHSLERPSVNVFCGSGGRKVMVSSLGEIQEAHD